MKSLPIALSLFTSAALLVPALAQAQPVFANRCNLDSLDPVAAESRLAWARRCALVRNVRYPSLWFDTYVPASSGGTLKDYAEDDAATNPWGTNRYVGHVHNYEVNSATMLSLYLTSPTNTQLTDTLGYYRWERPVDRKKARPLYPTFGSESDIYHPSNVPLYPNPANFYDCNLYTAAELGISSGGMQMMRPMDPVPEEPYPPDPTPMPAPYFYVNAYCESSCYAPDQRVLFPDGLTAISEAHAAGKSHVMTLAPGSTLGDVSLQAAPTYSYTAEFRDSSHPMVELLMASGGRLFVTTEHPLINGEGRLVQAQSLKVGDELVKPDGRFDEIERVVRTSHFGKVYNLRPASDDRLANILVAEGYLSGSSLFQNDEVGYLNRILLYKSLPGELLP